MLAGEIAINTNQNSANIHFEDASANVRTVASDPLATASTTQYVRQVATDGTGTWEAADDVYLSKVNDDSAAGNITFEAEVRVEGQFSASRNGQTDAVQVVPSTGSSQSSVLQVTRGASTSGNLPAIEVIQNGTETAQIQFDGRGRFSDVEITTETNAAALGTDANGKIINVGSTLDGKYLSSTEDDSAAGKITFEDDVTAEAGVTLDATKNAGALGTDANGTIIDVGSTLDGKYLSSTQDDTAAGAITFEGDVTAEKGIQITGGDAGDTLYKVSNYCRFSSPNSTSLFSVQDNDTLTSDSGNTVILGQPKADSSYRHCIRLQGRASIANQDIICAQAIPYQGGLALNSVTGFFVGNLIPEGATSKPDIYRCYQASAATAFSPLVYGFYSDINAGASSGPDASTNYAFYSAGTAASLLKGKLTVEGGFTSAGTDKDNLIQGGLTIGDAGDYVKVDDAIGSASNRMISLVRAAGPSSAVTALGGKSKRH